MPSGFSCTVLQGALEFARRQTMGGEHTHSLQAGAQALASLRAELA